LRTRALVAVCLAALVLPAQALAHGRGATIALDYRVALDPETGSLPGVRVVVLDGDRDLELTVARGVRLLVEGVLGEPMLRFDARGVFADANSPTATSDGIVSAARHGWVQVAAGRSFAWHDHRLAPPPSATVGADGDFSVPVVLDGRAALIAGRFFRVARPALLRWLLGAALVLAAVGLALRVRALRARVTIALAVLGGLAAATVTVGFALRDAPSGGVSWPTIAAAILLSATLGGLLVRLQGRARVHGAGVVGAIGAAAAVSSLPVFWHGAVISALPGGAARLACGLALVCGSAAAALSFLPDFDEPLPLPAVRRSGPLLGMAPR
jgi:hypothetical protein